ncbi:MAG: sigma-54-dependent Fis family transcriptional regulator [Deltaproteobacteria bacterium]|nr:sigma-54-dependent Fis family transcriptional regulator [Deltaproteobacteria bacterium]
MGKILVVDDDREFRTSLKKMLETKGYIVKSADCGQTACNRIESFDPDIILLDFVIPGKRRGLAHPDHGKEVLKASLADDFERPVIMLSDKAMLSDASEIIKLGAYYFFHKSEIENDEARSLLLIKRALEKREISIQNANDKMGLIGESEAIQHVRNLIKRFARSRNASVFIAGESGTGKELVARAIHQFSPRKEKPFVAVNCAAIPENLIEGVLFGHEKGKIFTGADKAHEGQFEQAHTGTIFLDEFADLSLLAQAKILRVVQDGEIPKLGSIRPQKVDVRILVATNKDIEQEVKKGNFREDLYYRLCSGSPKIVLPPLRERLEDIDLLADHFSQKYCEKEHLSQKKDFDLDAMNELKEHTWPEKPWPGNVRQLEHVIETSVLMADPNLVITKEHIELESYEKYITLASLMDYATNENLCLDEATTLFEGLYITKVFKECSNNMTHTSEKLGKNKTNLYPRLEKYKELKKEFKLL